MTIAITNPPPKGSAAQGTVVSIPPNTPIQLPIADGGVTLINQGSTQVELCTDQNFSTIIYLAGNSSLPWPNGVLWAKSTVATTLLVMAGQYNYSNSNVTVQGGTVEIVGDVTLAPGTEVGIDPGSTIGITGDVTIAPGSTVGITGDVDIAPGTTVDIGTITGTVTIDDTAPLSITGPITISGPSPDKIMGVGPFTDNNTSHTVVAAVAGKVITIFSLLISGATITSGAGPQSVTLKTSSGTTIAILAVADDSNGNVTLPIPPAGVALASGLGLNIVSGASVVNILYGCTVVYTQA